jgi:hypothetical protein
MEKIDHAFKKFEKILSQIKTYDDSIFSEQDSRVKIIDRILCQVLNYPFKDILTEPKAGKGFLDYKILVNGLPRLAIEAKKDGVEFNIENSYSGRAFNLNGPVLKDKAVQEGIDQSIYYAAYKGIELSCLTNGRTWIIFRSNRLGDGKDILEGKAFVFSTLESVRNEFKLFYELMSPEGVSDFRYRALFQEAEGAEIRVKDFGQALKTENEIKVLERQTYSHDFDRIMNEFFSRLSGDSDPEMLLECFVETKESHAADQELCRISEDLIRRVRSLETMQAEALTELIEKVRSTNRHEFVILMGTKGAGKSTFIDRFFENVISEKLKSQTVVVRINLAVSDGNANTIIDWLNHTLLEECERVLYDGKPTFEEIQGMFYFEYERLRDGNWNKLYQKDKDQFKIDFGKHIEERRENRPNEYIKRMIGDITKSRFKVPCLVFDNADHFSIDFQEKVFQYARAIYEQEICLVIVPITDKTSWQLSKQGAIQSFENEVLYLPVPSPKKIIEKRIEFLEKKLVIEKTTKGRYFLGRGIKLEIPSLEKFVKFLQNVFLTDDQVARWIGDFANYDIRRCLDLTRDIISSPHLPLEELVKAWVSGKIQSNSDFEIKKYRIKHALLKRVYNSYPVNNHMYIQNTFYIAGNLNTSPLLSLRLLRILMDRRNESKEDNYLGVDQLLDYCNGMGIERSTSTKHLDIMLKKGLLYSYDPTVVNIHDSKRIEISPSGIEHYYWSLNDNDYLFVMIEVTPISDKELFRTFEERYYSWGERDGVKHDFIDYLLDEDKTYIHVPAHEAYTGQVNIIEKLQHRQKQLKEWMKNPH